MLPHWLKFRENTESKNLKIVKTKNGRAMLLSKCAMCNSNKLGFIKAEEATGILGNMLNTMSALTTVSFRFLAS